METMINKLFDYQKFEGNARLKKICDSVEAGFSEIQELSDDELFMVAAGRTIEKKDEKKF